MQYLFRNELLVDYLDRYKINLRREIESCEPEYLLNVNEEDYYIFLVSKYVLDVPILREDEIHISERKELERENQGRPTADNASMLSGKLLLTISIPFLGNRHLFKCRPSSYTPTPPLGSIGKSEIRLHYEVADRDPDSIKKRYTKDIEEIKRYLQWSKKDLNSHNDWIKNNARKHILKRKKDLLRDQTFLESLGLPKRKPSEISQKLIRTHVSKPESTEERVLSDKKYDVFICHASEDKETFVRELAEALSRENLRVWYDEFSLSLGDSLRRKIDQGLSNSRYGVVVLSSNFFRKDWPQKELDGLMAKEHNLDKVILPIWHGVTRKQVESFSPILAGRLAVSSDRGMDYVVKEIQRAIR